MELREYINLSNGFIMSLENLSSTLPLCKDHPHFIVALEGAKHLRDKLIQEYDDMNTERQDDQNERSKTPDDHTTRGYSYG